MELTDEQRDAIESVRAWVNGDDYSTREEDKTLIDVVCKMAGATFDSGYDTLYYNVHVARAWIALYDALSARQTTPRSAPPAPDFDTLHAMAMFGTIDDSSDTKLHSAYAAALLMHPLWHGKPMPSALRDLLGIAMHTLDRSHRPHAQMAAQTHTIASGEYHARRDDLRDAIDARRAELATLEAQLRELEG